jgi:hypothetical protein
MFNVGEKVLFVAARSKDCEHCGSQTKELEYTEELSLVLSKHVSYFGKWPRVKACVCEEDCLCAMKNDYTQEPIVTTETIYRIMYGDKELTVSEDSLFKFNDPRMGSLVKYALENKRRVVYLPKAVLIQKP